ncbi:MAG: hypothetical protein RMJ98_00650 [Myxococcales bacterium]|nr:hypothetical protein [Polyangiaceae bacterium]MDW8247794.1 hypothetical protein [Myxococcales bacterium]
MRFNHAHLMLLAGLMGSLACSEQEPEPQGAPAGQGGQAGQSGGEAGKGGNPGGQGGSHAGGGQGGTSGASGKGGNGEAGSSGGGKGGSASGGEGGAAGGSEGGNGGKAGAAGQGGAGGATTELLQPKSAASGAHRASLFFRILPNDAREPIPVLASGPAPDGGEVYLVVAPPGPLVMVHEEISEKDTKLKTFEEPIPPDVDGSGKPSPAVYSWVIRQGNKLTRKTSDVSAEGHVWAKGARNSASCVAGFTGVSCDAMVEFAPDKDKATTLLLAPCEQDQVCSFRYSRGKEAQCTSDPTCQWDSSIQRVDNRYLLVGPGEIPLTQATPDPSAPNALKIPGIALVEISSKGPKVLDEVKPAGQGTGPVVSLFSNPRKEGTLQGVVLAEGGLAGGGVSVPKGSIFDVGIVLAADTGNNKLQLGNLGPDPCKDHAICKVAVDDVDGDAFPDLVLVRSDGESLESVLRTKGKQDKITPIPLGEPSKLVESPVRYEGAGDVHELEEVSFVFHRRFPDDHEEFLALRISKNTGGPVWTQRVNKNTGGPVWTQRVNKNTGGPIWTQKTSPPPGQSGSLSDESFLVALENEEELSFLVVDPKNPEASFQTSGLRKVNKNTGGPIWAQRMGGFRWVEEKGGGNLVISLPSPATGSWQIPPGQELPAQQNDLPWLFQAEVKLGKLPVTP